MASSKFHFDPALRPPLSTRKALLVLDLQKDFTSDDGALPLRSSEDVVERVVEAAKVFRDSGAGDVIWIRSEFDEDRPAADQIFTSDTPLLPGSRAAAAARTRRKPPSLPEKPPEDDAEAFLSLGGEGTGAGSSRHRDSKKRCVRHGTAGSELDARITSAVDSKRDLVLTKTHYSAFESSQLLMRLRTRFATEIYICGALTNISIYATALDAGRHGLATTIIEDCCGYRSPIRHTNAIKKLSQLTGCEAISADDLATLLRTGPPPAEKPAETPSSKATHKPERAVTSAPGADEDDSAGGRGLPLRPRIPISEDEGQAKTSSPPVASAALAQPPQRTKSEHAAETPQARAAGRQSPEAALEDGQDVQPTGDESPPISSDKAPPSITESSTCKPKKTTPKTVETSSSRERRSSSPMRSERSRTRPLSEQDTSSETPRQTEKMTKDGRESPSEQTLPAGRKGPDAAQAVQEVGTTEKKGPVGGTANPGDGLTRQPVPTEPLCEGDTTIFHDVLPPQSEDGIYERLRDEVSWLPMSHQGGEVPRRVCVQGEVADDGSVPVYRHPADESPPLVAFTPTVVHIKEVVEKILGHPLNHVLIQHYRTGNDYISEHSDKTLDIVPDTFICNVSLGAERTMIFRTKRPDKDPSRKVDDGAASTGADGPKRQTIRAQLPHNSLCRMGLKTNMRWLHAIRQDKRLDREKTPTELAFGGGRISLTFRRIGTFLDRGNTVIWGQGATSKTRDGACPVINGQTPEAVRMLQAFGTENHSSEFDWEKHYGVGFDVLHIGNAPRFFTSGDRIANLKIQLGLAEYGISYAKGSMGQPEADPNTAPQPNRKVRFVDNDAGESIVHGEADILFYLASTYGRRREKDASPATQAAGLTRLHDALGLGDRWRAVSRRSGQDKDETDSPKADVLKSLEGELAVWNGRAVESAGGSITANSDISLADCALWPVLHDIAQSYGDDESFLAGLQALGFASLGSYYTAFAARSCTKRVLSSGGNAQPQLAKASEGGQQTGKAEGPEKSTKSGEKKESGTENASGKGGASGKEKASGEERASETEKEIGKETKSEKEKETGKEKASRKEKESGKEKVSRKGAK